MTDQVLLSNAQSVILNTLSKEPEDLSYEAGPSFPILAKTLRQTQSDRSVTGAPAGQEVEFSITRSYLLRNMAIQSVLTCATGNQTTPFPGLSLFEYIQLKSNNKVIMTMSDAYIIARAQDCGYAKSTAIHRRALLLNSTTYAPINTSTAVTTFTPVFCSFFEDTRNNFDLNFFEQLKLTCKFNTSARNGLSDPWLTATCTLWTWGYMMSPKDYDLLRAKNQRPNEKLNMLTYNSFLEKTVCTAATTTTMNLFVNYPVFKTFVFVKNNVATTGLGAMARINSLSVVVAGVSMYETVPNPVIKYEQEIEGSAAVGPADLISDLIISRLTESVICINWGCRPMDRINNSGAFSFSNVNRPQIIVNYTSLTAANFDVYAVHEYWNILSLDSNNGSVDISVAN
jgi:hypothetical protein